MQIIGEKINGTRESVKNAVSTRDTDFIQQLARRQMECGADILDVNAGTSPDREPEDLLWLVKTVQAATDAALCLDSPNPEALIVAMAEVNKPPLINSISGEAKRKDNIMPLLVERECSVIALAMDDNGIPNGVEKRMAVIRKLFDEFHRAGVSDERVYVDPLVMAIATDNECGIIALDTMKEVRREFPNAHLIAGASNISFGMPARSYINQAFLSLSIAAGLDSAIVDPTDHDIIATIFAAEAVTGKDRHCMNYTRAYRAGKIGFGKNA